MPEHAVIIDVKTPGSTRLALSQAILLYTNDHIHRPEVYATVHPVLRGKGGTRLGAGVAATREGCAAFVGAMADQSAFAGFLAPAMLYVSPRLVAWWRAPAPARVWFDTGDAAPAEKHIHGSAVTPHPGLVFVLADRSWYVYAVKGADRPTPTTKLWRAPYFNINEAGHLCEGNIERPDRVNAETIAQFERAFFDSRFTHPNGRRMVRGKGGIYALWRDLLRHAELRTTFPESALTTAGFTLEACLRKHQSRGQHHD